MDAGLDTEGVLDEDTLLKVENLHTYLATEAGLVKAVNGVDITVKKEEVLGVVGERMREKHHCFVHHAASAPAPWKNPSRQNSVPHTPRPGN